MTCYGETTAYFRSFLKRCCLAFAIAGAEVISILTKMSHCGPAEERKYRISENSNLIKTLIVIYGLKEDTLRIKIKQKGDFSDF